MEHDAVFYLIPWIAALTLTVAMLALIVRTPLFQRWITRPESGRSQSFPLYYRLGGALLAAIFLALLMSDGRLEWNAPFMALLIGSLAIIVFSIADDLGHVAWAWHLSFQALLGLLVFSSGMRLDVGTYLPGWAGDWPAAVSLLGIIVWVVLVMNALNWADGTDGLMPGIAAFSFGTIFLLALRPEVNQPTIAILAVMLFGLALGLLFFNWHPAKILAGTGGAYFFGFALATLALYAGMKVATTLMVLAIPIFDALFVLARRLAAGHSPFLPDEAHLHHLLSAYGWRPSMIAFAYLALTALLGSLALVLRDEGKLLAFGFVGLFLVSVSVTLHLSLRNRLKTHLLT